MDIKKELFYIYRLLQEGYGPKYWWPYFKNRFFGHYLFRRLPKCDYEADPEFELHTICSKHDLWMLAWMLRSFLSMSGLKPVIVIHDDGSMDENTVELIKSKFSNVVVMNPEETKRQILEMENIPEIIKKVRKDCHIFLYKLLNIMLLSKAKKIIASDTDILYYHPPTKIIDFILDKTHQDALVQRQVGEEAIFDLGMEDSYVEKYKLNEKKIALMNGGYIIINRDKFNLEQLAECFKYMKRPVSDYFSEMGAWCCLLGQVNFEFLDPETYAIKGFLNDKMVMKHYTSPRRYEMFAYGIDKARKSIGG